MNSQTIKNNNDLVYSPSAFSEYFNNSQSVFTAEDQNDISPFLGFLLPALMGTKAIKRAKNASKKTRDNVDSERKQEYDLETQRDQQFNKMIDTIKSGGTIPNQSITKEKQKPQTMYIFGAVFVIFFMLLLFSKNLKH